MIDLFIDTDRVRKTLVDFIRAETGRAGYSHAVVGLSGGIDSALACFLAAEALGAKNVLAVRMPYKTSSVSSLEDAQAVIDATGVESITIPITEMADPLLARFPDMSQLRRANIMPRLRMIVLYDQSAAFNGLVVGTGNKTEVLLGYTTLYGDSACAFNPLGDLYKTQVRQLSRALGIPQPILDKAPSADLWSGQTDEGEMGLTYEEVDRLFYLLVEKDCSPEQCLEAGFSEPFVRTVLQRVKRNHFKRVMPAIARVSSRTFGTDFLYLRDWES